MIASRIIQRPRGADPDADNPAAQSTLLSDWLVTFYECTTFELVVEAHDKREAIEMASARLTAGGDQIDDVIGHVEEMAVAVAVGRASPFAATRAAQAGYSEMEETISLSAVEAEQALAILGELREITQSRSSFASASSLMKMITEQLGRTASER